MLLTLRVHNHPMQSLELCTAEGHKSDEILALNPRGQVSTVTRRCAAEVDAESDSAEQRPH